MNFKKNKKKIIVSTVSIFILIVILIFYKNRTNFKPDSLIITSNIYGSINYYEYDAQSNKHKIIYSMTGTNYPTGILLNDILYITKRDKYGTIQLYQYNIKTKKENQLTNKEDGFFNIDFIKCDTKRQIIVMRVVQNGHKNFGLAIYYIKNKKIEMLNKDEKDLSDQFFGYNSTNQEITVAEYSVQDKYNIMDNVNKTQDFNQSVTYKLLIKDIKGNTIKQIGSINRTLEDATFSPSYNSALFIFAQVMPSQKKINEEIVYKNLNSNKNLNILKNENFSHFKQLCIFDDKGFYFVASPLKNNNSQTNYNLYYDRFSNNKISQVLNFKDQSIISCTKINN